MRRGTPLASLSQLEELELVTKEWVDLSPLAGLERLSQIVLRDVRQLDAEDMARFRRARPDCVVELAPPRMLVGQLPVGPAG